jgi:hypothetical protein
LSGDDDLLLFLMNLNTRAYMQLGDSWECRLSKFVRILGNDGKTPFVLYLMCCISQKGVKVPIPEGASHVSKYEKTVT